MDIISEFENGDTIARIDGYDMPLYAGAPDLLTALDTLVWQLDRMDGLPDELERMVADAKAAITKAKGA